MGRMVSAGEWTPCTAVRVVVEAATFSRAIRGHTDNFQERLFVWAATV